MKVEIHCHSHYSKGRKIPWEAFLSPEDIFRIAKEKGYGAVAITDHAVNTSWKEAKRAARKHGMIFIPGIEVASKEGHVLALGLSDFVPSGLGLDETLDLIHSQGAIAVAAHPFDLKNEGAKKNLSGFDAVEVFNSLCHDRFSNMLAEHWAGERRKPGVAGSDSHTAAMIGMSANHVKADTLDSVLKEIRKGRVEWEGRYVPMSVMTEWFRMRLSSSKNSVLRYADRNYFFPKRWLGKALMKRFIKSRSPLWNSLTIFGYSLATFYSLFRSLKYF